MTYQEFISSRVASNNIPRGKGNGFVYQNNGWIKQEDDGTYSLHMNTTDITKSDSLEILERKFYGFVYCNMTFDPNWEYRPEQGVQ